MNNTEGGFSPFIITYKGLNLEAKLHARKLPLTITRAVIGGAPAESDNEALNLESIKDEITSRQSTDPGECATVDISRVQVEGNGIASMRVTVGSGDTPFTLCMIGIMAQDPDEGEILYMSASNARGDYFPGDKIIQANYDFVNILTQAEGVSVKPTLLSEVSYEEFTAHTSNTENPHNVTAEQVFPDNSDTLSAISGEIKEGYDTAAEKAHSHSNGSVLDNISSEKVSDWNAAHEHTSKKDNPHEVTAKQVGLGNVPNVSTNDQTPTYTAANEVAELKSGEKLSTAFGKIAAAIKKFISHLGDKGNPHGVTAKQVFPDNSETLSEISAKVKSDYDTAVEKAHSHNNSSVLNEINDANVSDWNDAHEHTGNKDNPHGVTAEQVGLGEVTNESKTTMFTSPSFTGKPTAPTAIYGANTAQIATTAFVQEAVNDVAYSLLEFGGVPVLRSTLYLKERIRVPNISDNKVIVADIFSFNPIVDIDTKHIYRVKIDNLDSICQDYINVATDYTINGFQINAEGNYVTKTLTGSADFDIEELIQALKDLNSGKKYLVYNPTGNTMGTYALQEMNIKNMLA